MGCSCAFTKYVSQPYLRVSTETGRLTLTITDDPKVPIHLLVYAIQTAVTTATCIADYMSWSDFGLAQKIELCKLYVPYLALSAFMGVDMYSRLDGVVNRVVLSVKSKKT